MEFFSVSHSQAIWRIVKNKQLLFSQCLATFRNVWLENMQFSALAIITFMSKWKNLAMKKLPTWKHASKIRKISQKIFSAKLNSPKFHGFQTEFIMLISSAFLGKSLLNSISGQKKETQTFLSSSLKTALEKRLKIQSFEKSFDALCHIFAPAFYKFKKGLQENKLVHMPLATLANVIILLQNEYVCTCMWNCFNKP